LVDLKAALGARMLRDCRLCERACGKNRAQGDVGHCGVLSARVCSDFLHMGEEPDLTPSYTIFFAGCTFNCVFCQNWDISTHPEAGLEISPADMARKIELRETADGRRYGRARNVNWVGGEPTSNLPYILEVLNACEANLPQVWNSNMYMSLEAMALLNGIVDVYLTDFKYGNDKCASRLSNAPHYMKVVERNHLLARANGEMIIRHLVLPEHVECCTRPALTWIAENLVDVKVNVMAQYRPEYRARDFPEIAHPLAMRDHDAALGIAEKLGLELCD
jgi:putative pyruvate formate lyase activating enzyme